MVKQLIRHLVMSALQRSESQALRFGAITPSWNSLHGQDGMRCQVRKEDFMQQHLSDWIGTTVSFYDFAIEFEEGKKMPPDAYRCLGDLNTGKHQVSQKPSIGKSDTFPS